VSATLQSAMDELRTTVGVVVSQELGPVSALWARRFALACGETDAIYFDDAAAAAAGWPGTPLPPLLLSSTRSWQPGPARDQLGEDGTALSDVGFPQGYGLRALGGGQSLHFHADATASVDIVAEAELTSANLKSGRSGELIVVELERRFSTADGQLLLTCDETRILR
jgi:N-terminal half of MaoC dehydratase